MTVDDAKTAKELLKEHASLFGTEKQISTIKEINADINAKLMLAMKLQSAETVAKLNRSFSEIQEGLPVTANMTKQDLEQAALYMSANNPSGLNEFTKNVALVQAFPALNAAAEQYVQADPSQRAGIREAVKRGVTGDPFGSDKLAFFDTRVGKLKGQTTPFRDNPGQAASEEIARMSNPPQNLGDEIQLSRSIQAANGVAPPNIEPVSRERAQEIFSTLRKSSSAEGLVALQELEAAAGDETLGILRHALTKKDGTPVNMSIQDASILAAAATSDPDRRLEFLSLGQNQNTIEESRKELTTAEKELLQVELRNKFGPYQNAARNLGAGNMSDITALAKLAEGKAILALKNRQVQEATAPGPFEDTGAAFSDLVRDAGSLIASPFVGSDKQNDIRKAADSVLEGFIAVRDKNANGVFTLLPSHDGKFPVNGQNVQTNFQRKMTERLDEIQTKGISNINDINDDVLKAAQGELVEITGYPGKQLNKIAASQVGAVNVALRGKRKQLDIASAFRPQDKQDKLRKAYENGDAAKFGIIGKPALVSTHTTGKNTIDVGSGNWVGEKEMDPDVDKALKDAGFTRPLYEDANGNILDPNEFNHYVLTMSDKQQKVKMVEWGDLNLSDKERRDILNDSIPVYDRNTKTVYAARRTSSGLMAIKTSDGKRIEFPLQVLNMPVKPVKHDPDFDPNRIGAF